MERNLAPGHTDDRPEGTNTSQRIDTPGRAGDSQQTDDESHDEDGQHDRLVFDCADYSSVGEAVVDALATVTTLDPLEMDPLYFHIDLDALERILGPKLNGQRRGGRVTVEFQVAHYDIVVNSDGLVSVSDRVE